MSITLTIDNITFENGAPVEARKGTNARHIMLPAPVMLGSFEVKGICGRSVGSSRDDSVEIGSDLTDGSGCKQCSKIYLALLDAQIPDAREDSAPVAEIPAEYVREVIESSKRAQRKGKRDAAIQIEREKLAARKAQRAERDAQKSVADMSPGAERDSAVKGLWEDSARKTAPKSIALTPPTGLLPSEKEAREKAERPPVKKVPAPVAETLPGLDDPDAIPAGILASRALLGDVGTVDLTVLPCEFKGAVSVINAERTHGKCPGCSAYILLLPEKEARESGPKVSKITCAGVGESPKPGTRVQRDNRAVSVPDDFDGKHSGKCPGCDRVIAVSREGGMRRHNGVTAPVATCGSVDEIGTHNVGGVATPAHKGLTSRAIDTVEHGSIPGDTSTADKRRRTESLCKGSRKLAHGVNGGKATCPVCTREGLELREHKGAKKTTYRFPDHVSALPSVKHIGRGDIRDVTPRGDGADVGATVTPGARLALSRGHGSVDGSATTGRQNLPPVKPKGWLGTAGTGSLPATIRPGVDKEVSGKWCPVCEEVADTAHRVWNKELRAFEPRSSSWKRRHAAKLRAYYDKRDAVRDAERAAKIASGEIIPAAERKAMRKAASIGSFSEGVVSGVVTHAPRPEFEPKGERKTAPRVAGPKTREAARKGLKSAGRK